MLNFSAFKPMEPEKQGNAVANYFNSDEVIEQEMPVKSIALPVMSQKSGSVALNDHIMHDSSRIEIILKKYVDETMMNYGLIAGAVLVSIIINVLIIMLMVK
jgi:hypothetical protein